MTVLVLHRTTENPEQKLPAEISDAFCRNYSLWNLYQRFRSDFSHPFLVEMFHETHKLR